MAKIINLFMCMSLALFGSSQSASFQSQYQTRDWGTLKAVYWSYVQNSVSITSLDAAQIDSISGTHKSGFNNDNVEVFDVRIGQIHYFPRGLNKIFKNLKAIKLYNTGLKEIHQSDLKDFPKLMNIWLGLSDLEIIEENLFEFNRNLEAIYIASNKFSHIDPNVFNKLTKLHTLDLQNNTCINMVAWNNPTELQNIIKTAKSKCINSDYSNLEHQVKNLEIESKSLNSENFKEKLENLENEKNSSKFQNFFQGSFNQLKAAQIKKVEEEKIAKIIESNDKKMDRLESKLVEIGNKLEEKITKSDQKIDEKVSKLNKDMSTTLKDIESANNQNFAAIMKFIENLNSKMEALEEKLEGIDDAQKKLMSKLHKIQSESYDNQVEVNQKLRAILKAV